MNGVVSSMRLSFPSLLVAVLLVPISLLADDVPSSRAGHPVPAPWAQETLSGFSESVAILVFSRDGKIVYAADYEGHVSTWNVSSRLRIADLPQGRENNIERLALSANGSRLISCSGTSVVHVWDLKTNQLIYENPLPTPYCDAAISPDGKEAVIVGKDRPVQLIDIDSGKVVNEFPLQGNSGSLPHAAYVDASHVAVSASPSGYVFEIGTGHVVARINCGNLIGMDLTGQWLMGDSFMNATALFSLADIQKAYAATEADPPMLEPALVNHQGNAATAAFLDIAFDQWNLVGSNPGGTAIDPRNGIAWPLYGQEGEPGGSLCMPALSPDGKLLLQPEPHAVRIVDLTRRPPPERWIANGPGFAIEPTHGWIVAGGNSSAYLHAWDPRTGVTLGGVSQKTSIGVYWQDGSAYGLLSLFDIHGDGTPHTQPPLHSTPGIGKIDLKSGRIVKRQSVPGSTTLAFVSPSSRYILLSFPNGSGFGDPAEKMSSPLQVYDADLNRIGDGFAGLSMAPYQVAFSPSESLIAARIGGTSEDNQIYVFNLKSRDALLPGPLALNSVAGVGVTDDGYLLAGTTFGSLACYKIADGRRVSFVEQAHSQPIQALAVSPDNRLVATEGSDHLIQLRSVPDLKLMGLLEAPTGDMQPGSLPDLQFSDARHLIVIQSNVLNILSVDKAFDGAVWNVAAMPGTVAAIAISKDGKWIALGDSGGVLTVVDNELGKTLYTVPANAGGIKAVEFIGTTHQIQTFGGDDQALTWDLNHSTNPISQKADKPSAIVMRLQIGGKEVVVTQGYDVAVMSPPVNSFESYLHLPNYNPYFTKACLLPGGGLLAIANMSDFYLFSLETQKIVWGYEISSPISGMIYDPLHQQLITSHNDGVTRRWALPPMAEHPE